MRRRDGLEGELVFDCAGTARERSGDRRGGAGDVDRVDRRLLVGSRNRVGDLEGALGRAELLDVGGGAFGDQESAPRLALPNDPLGLASMRYSQARRRAVEDEVADGIALAGVGGSLRGGAARQGRHGNRRRAGGEETAPFRVHVEASPSYERIPGTASGGAPENFTPAGSWQFEITDRIDLPVCGRPQIGWRSAGFAPGDQ